MPEPPSFQELYDQLAEAAGETPSLGLELELEELYKRHPATFAAKVREVIVAHHAGRVTSPWPFLRSTMRRLDEQRPTSEALAPEREKAIRLATTWLRNAGLYAPWAEAEAELFDRSGHLHPWADDDDLRTIIRATREAEQPRADQADAERQERHTKQAAAYFELRRAREP